MRLGRCDGCAKTAMVNYDGTRTPDQRGEFCAECFDRLNLGDMRPMTGVPSRSWQHENSPGWDNVIRAFEEDR